MAETMTPQDRAREAGANAVYEARKNAAPYDDRTISNAAIDAFLTTVLEGADERVAEIRERLVDDYQTVPQPDVALRLEDAKKLLGAFAASQTHLYNAEREIADYKETVSAFQSQLTAQKAAHAKMLRDEAEIYLGPVPSVLRRLADKIEGGE